MYDCIIIGGGVIGTAILRELSMYDIKICLLEAQNDVADGTSKANSGINHAGYDCKPNTLKAKYNIEGNRIMPKVCEELGVPYSGCGSIVVSDDNGAKGLLELQSRGLKNGVETILMGREELLGIEPNIADNITMGLYAKTAGVLSPYKLTIAYAEHAILNGAEVFLNSTVNHIEKKDGRFIISTKEGKIYETKFIVNAAGNNATDINVMAGAEKYEAEYRRGEYYLLDKLAFKNVNTVIFPLPDENGKGILVAPTADGNVIYGPTSTKQDDTDTAVTINGLAQIRNGVEKTYKHKDFNKILHVYSGVRCIIGKDFIIRFSDIVDNFFMLCGICSPGLTSAPAIGIDVANQIASKLKAEKKENIIPMIIHKQFRLMNREEINKLIKQDASWGKMACKCESVTEAEVLDAIHSPLPAKTVDAIKRRTRAGMGRCQGSFCGVKIMDILARELQCSIKDINKDGLHSNIAVAEIKEDGYEI